MYGRLRTMRATNGVQGVPGSNPGVPTNLNFLISRAYAPSTQMERRSRCRIGGQAGEEAPLLSRQGDVVMPAIGGGLRLDVAGRHHPLACDPRLATPLTAWPRRPLGGPPPARGPAPRRARGPAATP